MARVVSLTLFLLSWLLLFSYAASDNTPSIEYRACKKVVEHIHKQVQKKEEAQICPEKVIKAFDHPDVADFLCKIRPLIDQLATGVCYNLFPDACSVETPSTKDAIPGQPWHTKWQKLKKAAQEALHKAADSVRRKEENP